MSFSNLLRWLLLRASMYSGKLCSRLRILWFRGCGVHFGRGCQVGRSAHLSLGRFRRVLGSIVIGEECEIDRGAILQSWGGRITLGYNVYVGPSAIIYGQGGVVIGDRTLVSMHCRILSSNHVVPALGTDIRSQGDVFLPTQIGRDVWLGAGVTVLGGVEIGDGCVIGAGAVVTGDLPAGAIAVGVPAKVFRIRDK